MSDLIERLQSCAEEFRSEYRESEGCRIYAQAADALKAKDALIADLRLERELNRKAHDETQKQLDIARHENKRLTAEGKSALKLARELDCMLANHAKSKRAYSKMQDLAEQIVETLSPASDSQCKSDHVSARVENRPCESCGADDWVSRDNTDQVTGTIACQKCGVEVPHDCEYSAPDGEGQEKDHD